jgi:hypothetical protein
MRRDKASHLHTAVIAAVFLGGPPIVFAQTGGALQYAPPSVEGDAQPYPRAPSRRRRCERNRTTG